MNVLEMEEVESLVGNGRKTLNTSRRNGKNAGSGNLANVAIKKNFMTQVIVVACLVLMALFYVSMRDSTAEGMPDVDTKPPASALPETTTEAPVDTPPAPSTTPVDVASSGDVAPTAPFEAPVAGTSPGSEPAEVPTSPPVEASAPTLNKESYADAEEVLPYSKVSAFEPLMIPQLPDEQTREQLAETWGKWRFWDGEEDNRSKENHLAGHPNHDIPGEEFPDDAWQADAVFVNHYLNDADKLVSRAMEAIFSEYGHPRADLQPAEMAARMKQFHWEMVDMSTATGPPEKYGKRGDRGDGGWTTQRSYDGLVRRLQHAMMTSDTFTVVMGGHSAAAGEGNHFRQNQMMQFHKVMAPIFARLGVKLITRNMSMGGLGTVHNTMGMKDIYGDEIDLLIWDTGMTEGKDHEAMDMFIRQGLLSGNRVPVIWGSGLPFSLLKKYHEEADVDIGEYGSAMDGIPVVESAEKAKTIPWAARFLKCEKSVEAICKEEPRYCTVCWEDRADGIKPRESQRAAPKGQASWHPGWRPHQLTGRNLAFGVLKALLTAVNIWTEEVMGGPPLSDASWHVTEYYENIRTKVRNMDTNGLKCFDYKDKLPTRMCNTAMNGATQYTPRANPDKTSITSMLKPSADGYVPENKKEILFEGPDPPNNCYNIPEGEVDVYAVVAGRRRLERTAVPRSNATMAYSVIRDTEKQVQMNSRFLENGIEPGKGWEVRNEPPGYCDGTYDAICNRDGDFNCVLQGQHAARGAIVGNEYSGWLVMKVPNVKEGIIVIKIHTWHKEGESAITKDWTTVNNERVRRRTQTKERVKGRKREIRKNGLPEIGGDGKITNGRGDTEATFADSQRELWASVETPDQPDTMVFEYAIDGQITSLSKDEFFEKKQQIQRVVETITLLDDENFTTEPKDVEVAIRLRGCGRKCTFGLTHVYWA